MYDYVVVGAGLFGSVFAREVANRGFKVVVLDRRKNIAGNIYTQRTEGINVHKYGAHIFHTNNEMVWDYVQKYAKFNRFTNSPIANYKGEIYSMPFNMYTFNKVWGITTPDEAMKIIQKQKNEINHKPTNLEEQAISFVGRDLYEILIKGYTEKQWGRKCSELPSSIIKRLPIRLTFDNNYFNALYQGIPIGGYTKMVEHMLDGIEVKLNEDYLKKREYWNRVSKKIVFTGPIDEFYSFVYGNLNYRSIRFEEETLSIQNYQGNAVVNYTDINTPWTRIIEHKWFEFGKNESGQNIKKTIISKEFSSEWKFGDEPYYPINDKKNQLLYSKYKKLASKEKNIIFGGRLGEYAYYDMDETILSALKKISIEFNEKQIY